MTGNQPKCLAAHACFFCKSEILIYCSQSSVYVKMIAMQCYPVRFSLCNSHLFLLIFGNAIGNLLNYTRSMYVKHTPGVLRA